MGKCTQSLVHFVLRRLVSPRLPLRRHHVSTALGAAGSRILCFSMGICLPAMCPAVIYCFACGQKKRRQAYHHFPAVPSFTVIHPSILEKVMAMHSRVLAWRIPWTEEPGGLQSTRSLRVGHDWATSLSLFTFMHWRRKWQPTPSVLAWRIPGTGEPGGLPSMVLHRVGHDCGDLAAAADPSILSFNKYLLMPTVWPT